MKYQKKDMPPGGDIGGKDLPDRGVSSGIVYGPTTDLHREGYEDATMSELPSGLYDQYGPRWPGQT